MIKKITTKEHKIDKDRYLTHEEYHETVCFWGIKIRETTHSYKCVGTPKSEVVGFIPQSSND